MLKAVTGWLPGLAGRAASYAFDKPYLEVLKVVVNNYEEIMDDLNKNRPYWRRNLEKQGNLSHASIEPIDLDVIQ